MVISAINIFEGGALTVMHHLLNTLIEQKVYDKYEVIVFVHSRELYNKYNSYFTFIEKPKSRKNYLYRLYYEYIYFYKYSQKNNIYCWISMHDITPNVKSDFKYVYCHNPSPFILNKKSLFTRNKTVFLMSLLYKYIYKINIRKNNNVFVQQKWLKERFEKQFNISNVMVAKPQQLELEPVIDSKPTVSKSSVNNRNVFFYPSFPRAFKNFEVICQAVELLSKDYDDFEVWLTSSGNENSYMETLYNKYSTLDNIKWLGLIDHERMNDLYTQVSCLLFPSLIETWGLPITEAKNYNLPILAADLEYAHETVGEYNKVEFFNPEDYKQLAKLIGEFIDRKLIFKPHHVEVSSDQLNSWEDFVAFILNSIQY